MAGKVVSFINMKGGVGKTTLCIGIGEYLAHFKDKKILFIDLDPQFNTTQSLMDLFDKEDEYITYYNEENITVKRIFQSITKITEKHELPKPDDIIIKLDDNMDIIAGTINIIFEDNNKEGGKPRRIKKFIKDNKLRDKYDYIFIDCPPTISLYTDAALHASDYYLVPNRLDRYSMLGITLLDKVIERLSEDEDIEIKPLGIVYTMMKEETLKSNNLKSTFEKNDIVNKIGLFNAHTSQVNDLLFGYQGNIASKYKKSREDIASVCNEFIERIERND